jgi:Flp pilus assembly protein TadD
VTTTGPSRTTTGRSKLKPDYAKAFNNRGNACVLKGEYDRAIKDYDQAIKLKPDYADAFSNRGFYHFLCAQFTAAQGDLAPAVRAMTPPTLTSDLALPVTSQERSKRER